MTTKPGTLWKSAGQTVKADIAMDAGQLGFHNLPFLAHRKSVKKGFEFTLMVVGKSASLREAGCARVRDRSLRVVSAKNGGSRAG